MLDWQQEQRQNVGETNGNRVWDSVVCPVQRTNQMLK